MAASIIDTCAATLHQMLPRDASERQWVEARRIYMAAAQDVLVLLRESNDTGAQAQAIQADLLGYARTIGRQVEAAR
jgi:chemotaxis receptor (MCP) glutamine deamidase CheD